MSNIFSDEIIAMDKLDVGKFFGDINKKIIASQTPQTKYLKNS